MPKEIKEIEDEIIRYKQKKEDALKQEQYLKANEYKEKIEELTRDFDSKKANWTEHSEGKELSIGEEEIAQIVSSWTGIPVVKMTNVCTNLAT